MTAHPFECNGCGSHYTTLRYAARCCKVGARHDETGEVWAYSEEQEQVWAREAEAEWSAIAALYQYECSCGEHYKTVAAAVGCRKCRTYTDEGWCMQVRDGNGDVVWSRV